jgi:hypothetical protein
MFTYIVSLIDTGCARFLHSLHPNMTDDACAEGMDALAHSVVDAGSGPELSTYLSFKFPLAGHGPPPICLACRHCDTCYCSRRLPRPYSSSVGHATEEERDWRRLPERLMSDTNVVDTMDPE